MSSIDAFGGLRRLSSLSALFATALSLSSLTSGAALAGPDSLVIGGFTVARGGVAAIDGGVDLDGVRGSIAAAFPGSTIVGSSTLTPRYLSGLDVLFISSARASAAAITPLTRDEQAALLAFVKNGGTAVVCIDNDTFAGAASDLANESLLDPFGLDSAGTGAPWAQPATIPTPRLSPVSDGPFGTVTNWTVGWSGWFTFVPPAATVLGTINQNGLPGLVVFPRGSLAPCSGVVVLFSDTSAFIDGFFAVGTPNDILMRNTFDFVGAPTCVVGLCGDVDASGAVDGADLGELLAVWGTASSTADLDGDGDVNGADLGILLANWGPCSEE